MLNDHNRSQLTINPPQQKKLPAGIVFQFLTIISFSFRANKIRNVYQTINKEVNIYIHSSVCIVRMFYSSKGAKGIRHVLTQRHERDKSNLN